MCNCTNKLYQKSAQTAYNSTAQTIPATATTVTLLGSLGTNTGCSITTLQSGFRINNSGLYRISYDVTVTPTAAGNVVLTFTKDGVTLPCVGASATGTAGAAITLHGETVLCVSTCCAITPVISAVLTGAAGTINRVCANAVKLA